MSTAANKSTEDLAKRVALATAASVEDGIIGTILLPRIGARLRSKIGATLGGGSSGN